MKRVHLSIPVNDLGASMRFYQRLFGQDASKIRPDYANFRLDSPAIHLALVASSKPSSPTSGHFGIELPDQETLAEWRRRQADASVPIRDQPGAECCYAMGEKFWLNDPDGNSWEIWVRTGEADALEDRDSRCCAA